MSRVIGAGYIGNFPAGAKVFIPFRTEDAAGKFPM